MMEPLPSMWEALGLISRTEKQRGICVELQAEILTQIRLSTVESQT